jgi:hypothetical protein
MFQKKKANSIAIQDLKNIVNDCESLMDYLYANAYAPSL